MGGGDEREKSGRYTPGSGPSVLITPKGIFKFHPETKGMYLGALFSGVTVDDVRADIPWDLKVADPLDTFPVPEDAEITFLRRLSPVSSFSNTAGIELMMAHITNNMEEKAAAIEGTAALNFR